MELKDLIELFYTARNRFTAIQATWQYEYDEDMMRVTQARWARMHPPGSVTVLQSRLADQYIEERQQVKTKHVRRRIWWQKPDCWREEQQLEGYGNSVTILCKDDWWAFSSGSSTLYTNVGNQEEWSRLIREVRGGNPPNLEDCVEGVPFLDPSFLLVSHMLEVVGETTHAGREAVEVRANYIKGKNRLHEAFFWATADEYTLLVDKTYGILLRYAAIVDKQEFAVSSVEQVTFDEPIPEDVFIFTPPGL